LEKLILSAFLHDAEFNATLLPYISSEYFEDTSNQIIIESALQYCNDHKMLPPKIVLETIIESRLNIPQSIYEKSKENLLELYSTESKDEVKQASMQWKLDESLKWLIERRSYIVIEKSIQIMSGTYKENGVLLDKSAIPDMMQKAISITFDTTIGHDYFRDAKERYDFMHTKLNKIPFKIPILNKITNGGLERGTLNEILCETHGGKSLAMGSWGVDWLSLGYDVLVITLEMGEFKIGERMDANMLNAEIDQLKYIPEKTYLTKLNKLDKEDGYGRLIVKQYAMSSAGASDFRILLNELSNKQGYIPDIVIIDYLGLCVSNRFKKSENMAQIQKSVGEEIRGLAVEKNFCCVSALQTNGDGMGASDISMKEISEAKAHAFTADFMLAMISTPDLKSLGEVRIKQLKNRYGSVDEFSSFNLKMDRKKMRLYQDDDYTKSHPQVIERKKPDALLPSKSKFDNMRKLK
jgi:hypothetical protein